MQHYAMLYCLSRNNIVHRRANGRRLTQRLTIRYDRITHGAHRTPPSAVGLVLARDTWLACDYFIEVELSFSFSYVHRQTHTDTCRSLRVRVE